MDAISIHFDSYSIHPTQGLSRDGRRLHVTPKSLNLLWQLVQHPLETVTKETLFRDVWTHSVVSDAALSSCIKELRQVLQDNAREPRFIETVHRVGFRFLRPCNQQLSARETLAVDAPAPILHGRDELLQQLLELSIRARNGHPQLVQLEGPPGAGKSTLLHHFLHKLQDKETWQLAVGAAASMEGRASAYQPVLDAIQSLCLGPSGLQCIAELRRHAPTCLGELPGLLDAEELESLRRHTAGVTPHRWMRELEQFFSAVCARHPLVLLLENRHWADAGTLQWLQAFPGDRQLPMLVLTTVQPREDQGGGLLQAQAGHPGVTTLRIDPLNSADPTQARAITPTEQTLLEAVSLAGEPCSAATLAAGMKLDQDHAEASLGQLASLGYLSEEISLSEGQNNRVCRSYHRSNSTTPGNIHSSLSTAQRAQLHQRVATYLETLNGDCACALAPRIALHFDSAHDSLKAVHWYLRAAAVNSRRGAHDLAREQLAQCRRQLDTLPTESNREVHSTLGLATARNHSALEGPGSPQADAWYTRLQGMQQQLSNLALRFDILWELWVYYLNRGPIDKAAEIVAALVTLAERMGSTKLVLDVHHARWSIALMQGDLVTVREQTRDGMALCGKASDLGINLSRGCTPPDAHEENHHTGVCAGFFRAWAEGLMGNGEDARNRLDATIAHARDVGHPYSLNVALVMAAGALAAMGDAAGLYPFAEEAQSLAIEHGYPVLWGWSSVYKSWAEGQMGNLEEALTGIDEGLAVCRDTELLLFRPFQLSLQADLLLKEGAFKKAQESLQQAFAIADRNGDRLAWAEMHRLRGELGIHQQDWETARQNLKAALDFSRQQQARLLETRAADSMERLLVGQRARREIETQPRA